MNYVNGYIEPGTYKHYKGGLYVLIDVVTHMENPAKGKIERLEDPLVVYRDLTQIVEHDANGKPTPTTHKRYCRSLSEFTQTIAHNGQSVKRFVKI